jgi:RNA polymerase sigma factor (sigma-70 family)
MIANHNEPIIKSLSISEKTEKREWHGKNDLEIWMEFKKGRRSALIYIYTKYFVILYNYALRFNPDREDVKDYIQDLFIYLYKNRESINETDSIKFYLFKCLRRRMKVENDKMFKNQNLVMEDQILFEESPESDFIFHEEVLKSKKILNDAIKTLPQKQQEIVFYYYYQNFSYKEIAGIMGLNQVKSARKLLYRAIESLKSMINFSDLFIFIIFLLCV